MDCKLVAPKRHTKYLHWGTHSHLLRRVGPLGWKVGLVGHGIWTPSGWWLTLGGSAKAILNFSCLVSIWVRFWMGNGLTLDWTWFSLWCPNSLQCIQLLTSARHTLESRIENFQWVYGVDFPQFVRQMDHLGADANADCELVWAVLSSLRAKVIAKAKNPK